MTADLQAQLAEARDDLANAVCNCGHRAEWHTALIGCNAEDYTADAAACDCRCDWLDAIMPTLAALVSAHVAQVREGLADEIEAQIIPFDQRGTGSKREIAAAHNDGCRKSARIVRPSDGWSAAITLPSGLPTNAHSEADGVPTGAPLAGLSNGVGHGVLQEPSVVGEGVDEVGGVGVGVDHVIENVSERAVGADEEAVGSVASADVSGGHVSRMPDNPGACQDALTNIRPSVGPREQGGAVLRGDRHEHKSTTARSRVCRCGAFLSTYDNEWHELEPNDGGSA